MNVMKEELPEERESRFSAFVAGAVVYAGLIVVTEGVEAPHAGEPGPVGEMGHADEAEPHTAM